MEDIKMAGTAKTGLTPDSVKNMVFGAGVLFRNFRYGTHYIKTFDKKPEDGKTYYTITGGQGSIAYTEFEGSVFSVNETYYERYEGFGGDKIGATKEGAKVSITPEFKDIEVDGVLVKMKGLTKKTGEKASIEATVIDMNIQNAASAVCGSISYLGNDPLTGGNSPYVFSKADISEGDYITDLALVARRLGDGKRMIVVFKNALVTSGLSIATKNKETSGSKFTFEAYADLSDQNVETLPVEIIVEESR